MSCFSPVHTDYIADMWLLLFDMTLFLYHIQLYTLVEFMSTLASLQEYFIYQEHILSRDMELG